MSGAAEFQYRYGLSFPVQMRDTVRSVADRMKAHCNGNEDMVLYDFYHDGVNARPKLDLYLPAQYRDCELVVVFLCKDYADRNWCQKEWTVIRSLVDDHSHSDRVMYLWYGQQDTTILQDLGLDWDRDGFLPIDDLSGEEVWQKILKRYKKDCKDREKRESNALVSFEPTVATGIGEIPINQPADAPQSAAAERGACDTIALFIRTGGEEKEKRAYRWNVFVQWQGDARFIPVPENQFSSDPGFKSLFVKSELRQLIRCIRSWMAKSLVDYPLLDIYAPTELLDVDWESFCVDGKKSGGNSMRAYQHYLLRSSDRLLLPELNIRMGALRRMSDHLINGTGVWLPQEQLSEAIDIETMSGEALDNSHTPVAISFSTSDIGKSREAWLKKSLRSAIVSMSPLVVWPAKKCQLNRENVDRCLTLLSINRVDDSRGRPINRPHCPDQARLAKLRQQKHRDNEIWGLRILVDHPNRSPDRTMLQSLLSCGESSSKLADGDSSVHQQPLIST